MNILKSHFILYDLRFYLKIKRHTVWHDASLGQMDQTKHWKCSNDKLVVKGDDYILTDHHLENRLAQTRVKPEYGNFGNGNFEPFVAGWKRRHGTVHYLKWVRGNKEIVFLSTGRVCLRFSIATTIYVAVVNLALSYSAILLVAFKWGL